MMLELEIVSKPVGSCGGRQRRKLLLLLGIDEVIRRIILHQVYGLIDFRGSHIACIWKIFAETALIGSHMR